MSIRTGETPVPISNTKVKPRTADDTILETVWESRWMPESIYGSGKTLSYNYEILHLENCTLEKRDYLLINNLSYIIIYELC